MNDSFVVVYRTRRNQYDAAGALARSRRSRSVLPRGYTDPPTNRDRHTCSPQYSAHLLVRSKIVLSVPNHRVYCCSLNATVGRGMSNAIRLSIWLNSTSSVVVGAEERDVSAATHLLCLLRLSRCRPPAEPFSGRPGWPRTIDTHRVGGRPAAGRGIDR